MKAARILALLPLAWLSMGATKPVLVPDVSESRIEIRYSFTGAELLVDDRTAAIYELGLQNLQLSPGAGASPESQRRFEAGFVDLMERNLLYREDPRGVRITNDVLYRAQVDIPARVPVGTYTAETFLIRDGRVLAVATREIRVEKLGFERFVARAADRWSFTYGVVAVIVSLLLGWGGSALFRRV